MQSENVFAVIVWSNAPKQAEIVDDLARRFTLVALLRVEWTQAHWTSNLARLYGDRLPSAVEKAARCGTQPFLLAVVGDPAPAYRYRRTRRGLERVNRNLFAAREQYRRLTHGHDLVHATLDDGESAKDLFLVTGRERESFLTPVDVVQTLGRDLVGTNGWDDVPQLVRALELTGGCTVTGDGASELTLAVGDPWWAARIAFASDEPPDSAAVRIGEGELRVTLVPAATSRLRRFSLLRRR